MQSDFHYCSFLLSICVWLLFKLYFVLTAFLFLFSRSAVPKAPDHADIATQSTEVHVKPLLFTSLQEDALGYFFAVSGGGEIRPRYGIKISNFLNSIMVMEKKLVVFNKSGVNISGIQKIWVTRNLMCVMFPAEVHVERWNSTNANFLQTFQQPE